MTFGIMAGTEKTLALDPNSQIKKGGEGPSHTVGAVIDQLFHDGGDGRIPSFGHLALPCLCKHMENQIVPTLERAAVP